MQIPRGEVELVRIEASRKFLVREKVGSTEDGYRWEPSHAGGDVEKRRADDKSMTRALMPHTGSHCRT